MRLSATLISAAAACILALAVEADAQKEKNDTREAQLILSEASALIPQIEKGQQLSALANIAGQQIVAGDYEGTLATYPANAKRGDKGSAVDSCRNVSLSWEFAVSP